METAYATLVKVARSLQKTELLEDWPNVSIDHVEEYFEVNRAQLDLAHEALIEKPSVPLEYHPDWLTSLSDSHQKLCYLAFVFSTEIHLWAQRGDFTRAAEIGIKGLEYCNAMRRGGLRLDAVMSDLCASPILQQLSRIRTEFNSVQRRHLIGELGRIESERESFASIDQRDKKWEVTVNALQPDFSEVDRLIDDLEARNEIFVDEKKRGVSTDELRERMKEHYLFVYQDELGAPIEEQRSRMKRVYLDDRKGETREAFSKRMFQTDQKWPCLMRMLSVDLRLRSFKEEQGHFPHRLNELAAGNALACPLDPFTGKAFVYRRKLTRKFFRITNEAFDLHSPGPLRTGRRGVLGFLRRSSKDETRLHLDSAPF